MTKKQKKFCLLILTLKSNYGRAREMAMAGAGDGVEGCRGVSCHADGAVARAAVRNVGMPDHLHAVIHVTRVMDTSIRSVIRGYWQGVKKLGRAYTLSVAPELNSRTTNEEAKDTKATNEEGKDTKATNEGAYAFPVFTERPFIRPLSRRGQLHTMIRYVQMNPQRLATKRLKPGYFRVQKDIVQIRDELGLPYHFPFED